MGAQAQAVLQQAGGRRHDVIGILRNEDQDIDTVARPVELGQQAIGCQDAQVRRHHAWWRDAALAHADRTDQAVAFGGVEAQPLVVERSRLRRHTGTNAANAYSLQAGFGHGGALQASCRKVSEAFQAHFSDKHEASILQTIRQSSAADVKQG